MQKHLFAGIALALMTSLSPIWAQKTSAVPELLIVRVPDGKAQIPYEPAANVQPLEKITIANIAGNTLQVTDSRGKTYFSGPCGTSVTFVAGGALGRHTITVFDKKGKTVQTAAFTLDATTHIEDGAQYGELFDILNTTMRCYAADGTTDQVIEGRNYEFFVYWVLDNNNCQKGMKYFSPAGRDMVDLFCAKQRPNGMIWSFVDEANGPGYYETAYGPYGFCVREGNALYVRQPVENHVEYNFVNLMYQHWQASGDMEWMKSHLDCAAKALDYCVSDPLRWSEKYKLLKRPYTIDSWDFQIEDENTPNVGINKTMMVDKDQTKFGVFFGDNTGYIQACHELAKMYRAAGNASMAEKYNQRGTEFLQRLNSLAWNGRFFTHRIEEDTTLHRNLGVDEKSQIGHSNAYSINRGLGYDQNVAIINTYLDLKNNLPQGAPGEWYAIYPPFERGFGMHNEKWQYMNAGIAGHAAGELARGAYENGYEAYATDILDRLYQLGRDNKGKLYFAYTGAYPTPPVPHYTPIDLSKVANMSFHDQARKPALPWMEGTKGNDLRELPVGQQTFAGIPFVVTSPAANADKAAVALSSKAGFPKKVSIPVNQTAACVYLLHTASAPGQDKICGSLTFEYTDGSTFSRYLKYGEQLTGWWFPSLRNNNAGIAWEGANPNSLHIGLSWAAIANPNPEKIIRNIVLQSPVSDGIYTLAGLSLSDQPHYVRPPLVSYGGPDNWSGANAMAALVEGLAGVKDEGVRFEQTRFAPRWITTPSDSLSCVIRYAASDGYVAYTYRHNRNARTVSYTLTGSGNQANCHFLLPTGVSKPTKLTIDGASTPFTQSKVGPSDYIDFSISPEGIKTITIHY